MASIQNITEAINALKNIATALPEAIAVDSTLTQEGQAADAKIVGDALKVEVIDLDELSIGFGSFNTGAPSQITVPEHIAIRFKSFRNGQLIVMNYLNSSYSAIGLAKIEPNNVKFSCLSVDHMIWTMDMNCTTNFAEFRIERPAAAYHQHSADEIDSGMFNGLVRASQNEDSNNGIFAQDPSTSLLRNTAILPEETIPEHEGEIYWTYE